MPAQFASRAPGRHALWRAAAALALLALAPARAPANPPDGVPIITRHQARIAGRELAYSAEVGRIAIRDVATGQPHGYMFYTAYRADTGQQSADAKRPVMFIWDGGPGGAGAWLHVYIAGPGLVRGTELVGDSDSWL